MESAAWAPTAVHPYRQYTIPGGVQWSDHEPTGMRRHSRMCMLPAANGVELTAPLFLAPMRIVSFLSSATEIVALIGLGDDLVGISHECDHPPHLLDRPRVSRVRFDPAGMDSGDIDTAVREAMARFGSVYQVDVALLRRLAPEIILTQAVCEVCAVPTGSVMEAVGGLRRTPRVVSLDAHSVEQILQSIADVGLAAGADEAAARAVGGLRDRISAVEAAVRGRARPRVLLLEWLEPPFIPGHWVPEMVEIAGGVCLAGVRGGRSPEVAWESLAALDPDVLLIEPCGYDLERAVEEACRFEDRLRRIAPRAYAEGRVWALDSGRFSRSGPRVIEGIEALAAVLHPDAFDAVPSGAVARRVV